MCARACVRGRVRVRVRVRVRRTAHWLFFALLNESDKRVEPSPTRIVPSYFTEVKSLSGPFEAFSQTNGNQVHTAHLLLPVT